MNPIEQTDRTRAGYVALVGLPNVGKSTLLNALIGEKLSAVTSRAQTTRERVLGIYTGASEQIVFVDTPGLLEPRYLLQRSMAEAALAAVDEADVVLLLLDGTRAGANRVPVDALERLKSRRDVLQVAINKIDAASASDIDRLERWSQTELGLPTNIRLSAANGEGVEELRQTLVALLPGSPFFYPPDEIAVQPVRFFVSELIRETIFEEYREEVPYSTAVVVEEYREASDPVYIRATVFVERASQKGILIGEGGASIRTLSVRSRQKIEAFVQSAVYLDLWIKAMSGWRRKRESLRRLGYSVPGGGSMSSGGEGDTDRAASRRSRPERRRRTRRRDHG